MFLDKSQIKRILKDHCLNSIRRIEKELAIDSIAQELIEHEKEIINKISIKTQLFNMIDKFLTKQSNKKCGCDCK